MSSVEKSTDAIVVGGGIIGCSLALALQRREIQTLLVERGQVAREATWASAGIIGPPTAAALPTHRAQLAERSAELYDSWVSSIAAESGLETTHLRCGKLLVARTEAEVEGLQAEITWQRNHGFQASWLEPDEVRAIEPIIPTDILGAYYSPDGGALTLHRFTEAIVAAFQHMGGRVVEHTPVLDIVVEHGRAVAVRTAGGKRSAETIILATGSWIRELMPGGEIDLKTMPVKGQMIAVAPRSSLARPQHVIGRAGGGYLVPRIDGSVAIGATVEEVGFDRRLTPAGITYGLELIRSLGPDLLDAEFITGWAGIRPGTRDETPIMGPVPGIVGLWISTGHFRTGAQLAPGSAELLANAISGSATEPLLESFSPNRFLPGHQGTGETT